MLDLGFIEDVEKILRMCPSGRQTALFSATMPPPIQRLAEGYMYDPTTIRITPKTLTVDAIAQAFVEVPAKDKAARLVELLKTGGTRAGDHLLPHQDRRLEAGEDAEGQRPRRQGAARRHEPGLARRRDDRLQGPPGEAAGGDRHRRPRPRHRARHPRDQLRRARLLGGLRPPHRPHRPGRAHRPRDHLRHPRPARRDRPHRARREDHDRRVGEPRGAPRARASAPAARAARAREAHRSARRRSADTPAAEDLADRDWQHQALRQPRRAQRHNRGGPALGPARGRRPARRGRSTTSASCTASPSSRSTPTRPSARSSSSTARS